MIDGQLAYAIAERNSPAEKAQAFADGVDAKLGQLIRLIEPGTDFAEPRIHQARFHARRASAAAGAGEPMPIDPGEHEVTAAVDATFALEP